MSSTEIAAGKLRALALDAEPGALIGSEEALRASFGLSRPTVRQAARMLEREGLIRVRRGTGGGYIAARPDIGSVEQIVATYMETRSVEPEEMTSVTSALWIETVRRAALAPSDRRARVVGELHDRVTALPDDADFVAVIELEEIVRTTIFEMAQVPYIELIFRISETFGRRSVQSGDRAAALRGDLVALWRDAKAIELAAIARGDVDIAEIGARRVRGILRAYFLQLPIDCAPPSG